MRRGVLLAVACLVFEPSAALAGGWTHFAGGAARVAIATAGAATIQFIDWISPPLADEEYVSHMTPIGAGPRVYGVARVFEDFMQVGNRVIAFDVDNGQRVWQTDIDADAYESWSSPALHTGRHELVVCAGTSVYALDSPSGAIEWQAALAQPVVNASPAVSSDLTSGGTPANRVFITDFEPTGGGGNLYAINLDEYAPPGNPYQRGDIVWSAPITNTSGNTPAYASGVVYVASVSGGVFAFDALSGAPLWSRQTPSGSFFGGVTVSGGYVYAATYNLNSGSNNSLLYKLNASDGQIVWYAWCERSVSTPIVAPGGRIYLSGGINGFGSAYRVQAFDDAGASASLAWDTFAGSGGSLIVGGWAHQPAIYRGVLIAGVPDSSLAFAPYVKLLAINPVLTPGAPGFVAEERPSPGGSPSLFGIRLYSFGPPGLVALVGFDIGTTTYPLNGGN